jgi:plastocyanin
MRGMWLLLAAAMLVAVVASAAAAKPKPKLRAVVSDPVNISLTANGSKVSTLKPGRYTIVVHDEASDHDFHLTGPGVDKSTTVDEKTTATWTVTLRKGKYTYVCDPHAVFMKGSFTVK